MTNTSLLGAADTLEHLDIANINLNGIEVVVPLSALPVVNNLFLLRTAS